MTANGTNPTETTKLERLKALARPPTSDEPSKLSVKGLNPSPPSGYDFQTAKKRQDEADAHKRDAEIKTWLDNARLPKRHGDRLTLHGVKWLEQARRLHALARTGYLAVVIGDRGRGKTQLGVKVIQEFIHAGKGSARYMKAMDLFMAIRATYRRDAADSEADVLNRAASPSLLVIDAAEVRSDTAWEDRLLSHMVDGRYDSGKDTIIIGNIAEDILTSALGHSIISRANETGGVIVCDWPSFREETPC